ncbi:MAG: hypothetical protein ABIP71_02505 [Verrucomicrobiota bacterium]
MKNHFIKIAMIALDLEHGLLFVAMAEITTKVCGVTFESFFKKAVLFKEIQGDEFARKSLEAFASYGLRPTQIHPKWRSNIQLRTVIFTF